LSLPGEGGSALLGDFVTADVVNAVKFEVTPSGDWIADVAGLRYHVLPGVIPDSGRFVFVGVPSPETPPSEDPSG
jgi:hypothetical protein